MKTKKLLAAILAVAMVLGTMSFPAFAETDGSGSKTVAANGQLASGEGGAEGKTGAPVVDEGDFNDAFDDEDNQANPVAKIGENTYGSLADAVATAQEGDTIKLVADVTITETYTIANTNAITIDFGGHYINTTAVDVNTDSLCVAPGADVTFTGEGGMKGKKNCLTNNGGKITLNGGTYSTTMIGRGSTIYNGAGELTVNSGVTVDAWKFALCNEVGAVCTLNGGTFESHAHNGLQPEDKNLVGYAYAMMNSGTMDVYDGVVVKGIQGAFSASGRGVTNIYGGSFSTHEEEENTAGRSFYACYAANNADLTIWGGTFTAAKRAAVYVGNEDVGLDGAMVKIKGGSFTSNGGAQAAAIQTAVVGDLNISGGTFSSDVSQYVDNGILKREDDKFTVQKSPATIINTAKTTGAKVTLDGLSVNSAIKHEADTTYQVVVESAPQEDVQAVNDAIANSETDKNTDKAIFDISVIKIDSNGTTTKIDNIENQLVTLTLGETPAEDSTVYVYHVTEDGATKVTGVSVSGNKVTFTAPSFSTYAVTYTASALETADITGEISVAFQEAKPGIYNILLKAAEGKKINRFMSADLTFAYTPKSGKIGYSVTSAANVNLILKENESGRYEFNMSGETMSSATGAEICIGQVMFEGYGEGTFAVTAADTNKVHTAEIADNIVYDYVADGGVNLGTLNVEGASVEVATTVPKNTLTINVTFPNEVVDQVAAYQAMKVVISGGDLTNDEVYELGTDEKIMENGQYVVTTELTKDRSFTVTVSGEGYRTARYTVNMNTDKILTFWNNVKDNAVSIEDGKEGGEVTTNFLAGDIVKDNNINIYDLSAVVSYFGEEGLTERTPEEYKKYVKYDLNRDGKIDSKDVAYVLVSWDK